MGFFTSSKSKTGRKSSKSSNPSRSKGSSSSKHASGSSRKRRTSDSSSKNQAELDPDAPDAAEDWYMLFTVQEMLHHPRVPSRELPAGAGFRPSKAFGSNIGSNIGDHNTQVFVVTGGVCAVVSREALDQAVDADKVKFYSEVSVYVDPVNHRFWCVDDNAIENTIGDGLDRAPDSNHNSDDDSDDDSAVRARNNEPDDPGVLVDWEILGYHWMGEPADTPGMSEAVFPPGRSHLNSTKRGQTWHRNLLPSNHFPTARTHRHLRDVNAPIGSLCGDPSLLLALLALTTHNVGPNVSNMFQHCVRSDIWSTTFPGWRALPLDERHLPWTERRGIVVTVYIPVDTEDVADGFMERPVFL